MAQVATTANAEYRTPALRAKAAADMDPWIRGPSSGPARWLILWACTPVR